MTMTTFLPTPAKPYRKRNSDKTLSLLSDACRRLHVLHTPANRKRLARLRSQVDECHDLGA
jgi:hypothetical protein